MVICSLYRCCFSVLIDCFESLCGVSLCDGVGYVWVVEVWMCVGCISFSGFQFGVMNLLECCILLCFGMKRLIHPQNKNYGALETKGELECKSLRKGNIGQFNSNSFHNVRNASFKEISEPSTYLIYTNNREFKSNHPEKNLNVEGNVTKKIMVF